MLKPQAQIVTENTMCIRPLILYLTWITAGWFWWFLRVAFEALAKCTWLFSATKWRQGPRRQPDPFWRCSVCRPRLFFSILGPRSRRPPNPAWRAGLAVAQLHLHRARWVQLLRSTMNVYSSSTSPDLRWCWYLVSYICFQFLCRQRW